MIKYPAQINLKDFSKDNQTPSVKYGLPPQVYYCKKCVISNQRPNSTIEFKNQLSIAKKTINFDSNGICDACNYSEVKKNINWQERDFMLKELCDKHRKNDGSYDCIVPGSGGKDSFYASHILKTKYGMNPLTVTWAPHIYTDWGWSNFQSWIHAGFDNLLLTPNGNVHRLLTRLATELLFHPFQPFILGQKSIAPKMALLHNISLIFYGENEAEYGNPISDTQSAKRDFDYFSISNQNDIHLGGVSCNELVSNFGLSKNDLKPYLPANLDEVKSKNIEVHYLGFYLKWHPQSCYYYAVEHGGFKAAPERTPGTYSKYNSIDDRMDDLHYFTTGIKFGIGRASYDAAQEIRSGDINREEGIALVKKFDHEFPDRFIDQLFTYISISKERFPVAHGQFENGIMDREYFDLLTDNFRSSHIWIKDLGSWRLRNPIWDSN